MRSDSMYPKLSEAGEIEAQKLMDVFKEKFKKIADDILGDLYCDVAYYIESDSWVNYRNAMLDGIRNYANKTGHDDYVFKKVREGLLKNYREEIIKDLNQDLLEEVEQLKKQLERAYDRGSF